MKGVYYTYGQALAAALDPVEYGLGANVLPSSGSIENLTCLLNGGCDVVFSAADAASARYLRPDRPPLTALARVYDDYMHVVVEDGSRIDTLNDLRGATVSIGPDGSGTALIAERLLDLAGVALADLDVTPLGIDESIGALQDGNIDAFFWSGGLPTTGVAELALSLPVRLLPLERYAAEMSVNHGAAYRKATIPEGTYVGVEQTATIAVPNYLVTRSDLPYRFAYNLLATLLDHRPDIGVAVPVANWLDPRTAIYTDPLPLHPGALGYYRDFKP